MTCAAREKPPARTGNASPMKRVVFWTAAILTAGALALGILFPQVVWSWMEPARKPTDEIAAILEECDAKPPTTPAPALARSGTQPTILPANTHLGWPALRGPAGDNTSPETGLDLEWPETGPREKWRIAVGSGYSSPVVVAGSLVLPHRRDDREIVECFDPETGQDRKSVV